MVGHLSAGPTCPVETVPPDPACAPKPVVGASVIATDGAGVEVSRAISRADGSYALTLAPGTYSLAPQPIPGKFMRAPMPKSVIIGSDANVVVDFTYDTGIR